MKKTIYRRDLILIFMFLSLAFTLALRSDLHAFSFFKDESYYEEGLKAYQQKDYGQSIYLLGRALRENPRQFEAKQLLGWNYLFTGRLIEAEAIFLALHKEKNSDVRPVQGLAWTCYGLGKYDKAGEYFKDELIKGEEHTLRDSWSYYPKELQDYFTSVVSDANYGLGLVAKQRQEYRAAIQYLQTALMERNQFTAKTDMLMALGDVYYALGKEKDALKVYGEAIKENQESLPAHLKLAWAYYNTGQYQAAEEEFERVIRLKSGAVEGVYGMALCRSMQSRDIEAYYTLIKAIGINPYYVDNPTVQEMIARKPLWKILWKEFGLAYKGRYAYNYRLGNYPVAQSKLTAYLKDVNPGDADAMVALGWCYRWLGEPDKAIDLFKAAARLDGRSAEPYVGIGSAYMAKGRTDDALASFQRALAIDPDSPTACNGLAYLHYQQKALDKTEYYLRKSLSRKGDYFDSQAFLANLLFEMKRYDEAAREYEKLVRIDEKLASSWNGLGWACYAGGKYDRAAEAFNASKALTPFLVETHYGLGLAYAKAGKRSKAKEEMVAAIEIDPWYSHTRELDALIEANKKWRDLYVKLGWSYYDKGNYQAAKWYFERMLTLEPSNSEARRGIDAVAVKNSGSK